MCVGVNVSCNLYSYHVNCIKMGGVTCGIYDVYTSKVVAIKKSFVSLFYCSAVAKTLNAVRVSTGF